MTRSVPPRTRVVAKVCRRTWAVISSSMSARAAMPVITSWAPLTPRRWPRWLRNSAALSLAPGQFGRSSSQPARTVRSLGWTGTSRTLSPLPRMRRASLHFCKGGAPLHLPRRAGVENVGLSWLDGLSPCGRNEEPVKHSASPTGNLQTGWFVEQGVNPERLSQLGWAWVRAATPWCVLVLLFFVLFGLLGKAVVPPAVVTAVVGALLWEWRRRSVKS